MRKIETILTIAGILIVVMFLFLPTNALADQRPYAHYHYDPGTPTVPYSKPQDHYYYLSDEFTLTVRLVLTDMSWKFSMPDFHINFAGKEEYVPSSDFYDDGKVKVNSKWIEMK